MSQRLIPTGERSGLQTRSAPTVTDSLCVRMKRLTAFIKLRSATRDHVNTLDVCSNINLHQNSRYRSS